MVSQRHLQRFPQEAFAEVSEEAVTKVSQDAFREVSEEVVTKVSQGAVTKVSQEAAAKVSQEAFREVSEGAVTKVSPGVLWRGTDGEGAWQGDDGCTQLRVLGLGCQGIASAQARRPLPNLHVFAPHLEC